MDHKVEFFSHCHAFNMDIPLDVEERLSDIEALLRVDPDLNMVTLVDALLAGSDGDL